MTEPKNKHITRQQEFTLGKMMEPVFERYGENAVKYLTGWSDERVLKESALPLSVDQVGRLRVSLFGKLVSADGNTPMERVWATVRRLEQRVEQLEQRFADMEDTATKPVEDVIWSRKMGAS